jgi:hypothetical protein
MKRALLIMTFCVVASICRAQDDAPLPDDVPPEQIPEVVDETFPNGPIVLSNESEFPLQIWIRPKREKQVRWLQFEVKRQGHRLLTIGSDDPFEMYVQCPDMWIAYCDEITIKPANLTGKEDANLKIKLIGRYDFTYSADDPGKQIRHFRSPSNPFTTEFKMSTLVANRWQVSFTRDLVAMLSSRQTLQYAKAPELPEPLKSKPDDKSILEVQLRPPIRLR